MYMVLMGLVEIHAQISCVAENLLERAMNALVENIAEVALLSFKQVKRFGMGGMLRVCDRTPSPHVAIIDQTSLTGHPGGRVFTPIPRALCVSTSRENAGRVVHQGVSGLCATAGR